MKHLVFLAFLTCTFSFLYAQRANYWYFGSRAGINFTSRGPVALSNGRTSNLEGCATMSDFNGNLLFYTDGVTVWNKNHQIMQNGSGLAGGSSSCQSSIVIPLPENDSIYLIFTAPENESFRSENYCMNVVNVNLNGGLGAITQKNFVFERRATERITAVSHANGIDFWIITNERGANIFRSYLVTKNGVDFTNPTISRLGRTIREQDTRGMLKASPDGKFIIQTAWLANPVLAPQLMKFDATTGRISDPIIINFLGAYGVAFSPNSSKLYLSTSGFELSQYDLQRSYDSLNLNSSKFNYIPKGGGLLGDLSLGPDGKIYTTRFGLAYLSGFQFPDSFGTGASYNDTLVVLSPGTSGQMGLPNFYNNISLPPAITISAKQTGCLTYKFKFNASFNGFSSFNWSFGDGKASTDSFPTHTYKRTSESFTVQFNFKSKDGNYDITVEKKITLSPIPVVDFTANTNGCFKDTVQFKSTVAVSNGAVNYLWQLGDGSTSIAPNLLKRYADTGTFITKLFIKDSLGCASDTITKTVTVNKLIRPALKLQNSFCSRTPVLFTDSSFAYNTAITQWQYSMGDGIFYNNALPNQVHIYAKEGIYNIKMVLKSDVCVSDTFYISVTINARPQTGFVLPENCVNDISSFIDTSTISTGTINFWKWRFGNDLATPSNPDTSILKNPSHKYGRADFYNVTLITRSNLFCFDTLTQKFTVNGAVPDARLNLPQLSWCTGDSIKLTNTSMVDFGSLSRLQIQWDAINTFTDENPLSNKVYAFKYNEFRKPESKTQKIQLRVQSGISCFNEIDTIITLKAQPRIVFDTINAVCNNANSFILNQGRDTTGINGNGVYSGRSVFFANNNYQFNPRSISANSTTSITYRFTSNNGCFDEKKRTIQINPAPVVDAGADKRILAGDSVMMDATVLGNNLQYNWSPAFLLNNNTILNPKALVKDNIIYLLKATNEFGCSDTNSVFIKALKPLNPPNAFSPNGDGIHDRWEIPELFHYPGCVIEVFNRYGQPVYKAVNYTTGWDGNIFGKPVPFGTYYYVIQPGSGQKRVAGSLTILR